MCLSKLPCIVWNFDLPWGNFEIPHGLWPQKKLNRLILVKLLMKLSCFFFIVVTEQNIAVPLYLYPISTIKVSGDFKVASEVSKFPTMRGNFERHIFNWLIFIWSHYWRKKSIQLEELTNTYVKKCIKWSQVYRFWQWYSHWKLKILQSCPGLRYGHSLCETCRSSAPGSQ